MSNQEGVTDQEPVEQETKPNNSDSNSVKDNDIMRVEEEPVSRTRRAYYIFSVTAFSLISSVGLIIFGYESTISEKVALSLLDLVQVFGIVYVTAGVIDRGGVIARVIEATRRRR